MGGVLTYHRRAPMTRQVEPFFHNRRKRMKYSMTETIPIAPVLILKTAYILVLIPIPTITKLTCIMRQVCPIPQPEIQRERHTNTIEEDQKPENSKAPFACSKGVVKWRWCRKVRVGVENLRGGLYDSRGRVFEEPACWSDRMKGFLG